VTLSDTSPEARRVYYRRLAEMTPSERVRIGVALWEAGDALQRSALRHRYPDADDEEITYRIAVTRFGEELARKVYGRP
jgi:hypothetical protein